MLTGLAQLMPTAQQPAAEPLAQGPAPALETPPATAPEPATQPPPARLAAPAPAFSPEFVSKTTQDYTNIPAYYTSSHWRVLHLGVPATKRLEVFTATPRALGCYHPNEESVAAIVGCYLLACDDDPEVKKLTAVQKHILMDIVKEALRPKRNDTTPRVFLKYLPENPEVFQRHGATASLFAAAYNGGVLPVRFPHSRSDLYSAMHSFPWRMSKLAKQQGVLQQGAQQWATQVAGPHQAMAMLQGLMQGVALLGQGQQDVIPGMQCCDRSQRTQGMSPGTSAALAVHTGGDHAAATGGAGNGAPGEVDPNQEGPESEQAPGPGPKKRKSPEEAASALLALMDAKKDERKKKADEEKKNEKKQKSEKHGKEAGSQKVRGPAPELPKIGAKADYRGAVVKRFPDLFKVHIPKKASKDGKECDVTKKNGRDPTSAFEHCLSYVDARV